MKLSAFVAVVLVGVAFTYREGVAQQTPGSEALRLGERVRYTTDTNQYLVGAYAATPLRWKTGVLDSIAGTHIWVRSSDVQLRVPLEVLSSLQVKRERRSALSALAHGTLAGAGLGAITGLLFFEAPVEEATRRLILPFTAVGFGMSLVMLPALTEGWQPVPLARFR